MPADRDRLAAIVESTDDAIIGMTLDGYITNWNGGAEQIFGYKASEAVGAHVSLIIPQVRQGEEERILSILKQGERVHNYDTVRQCRDGTLVDISLSVSPIRNSAGRIVGAAKIARNITRQKQSEAELRQAQTELRRANKDLEAAVNERTAQLQEAVGELQAFAYSISHDLRAPLRTLHGYARVLREDYANKLPTEVSHYLDRIETNSHRLNLLVQQVLNYSRISRSNLIPEPLDLHKVVQEAIEQSPCLHSTGVQFQVVTPLPRVQGHSGSLMQCLLNLISNACKFVPAGTRPMVKIWAEQVGSQVRIWVEDNGIGIAPKDQERIFGVFERLNPESAYEGSGLGLAIVRKAVERMGGQTGVMSAPGKGSRFWIQIPKALPRVDEEAETSTNRMAGHVCG